MTEKPKKTESSAKDRLNALNQIASLLDKLDSESQNQVLNSVLSLLGLDYSELGHENNRRGPSGSVEPDKAQSGFSKKSNVSPKSFLLERSPSTNVDRVACLAYFLTHYRDTPHFKTVDISKLNTEGAQPKFTNASVAVNDAAVAKLIVPSTKGNKQISAMGEQYVLALPDREKARIILKKMRPKTRRKKSNPSKKNKK